MFTKLLLALVLGSGFSPNLAQTGRSHGPSSVQDTHDEALVLAQRIEAIVAPQAKRLLQCDDETSFLAALDLELFQVDPMVDLLKLVSEKPSLALLAPSKAEQEAFTEALVAITSEKHRRDISQTLDASIRLAQHIAPDVDSFLLESPQAIASSFLAELGDAKQSRRARLSTLAFHRSNLAYFALVFAAQSKSTMRPWMANLTVQLWRQGQEQLFSKIQEDNAPPPLRVPSLSPFAETLLGYSCHDTSALSIALSRDDTLPEMLEQIRNNLRARFPENSIEHLVLRPSLDPEVPAGTALLVEVQTRIEPVKARAHLDRFDDAWWLDVSSNMDTELSVDVRPA